MMFANALTDDEFEELKRLYPKWYVEDFLPSITLTGSGCPPKLGKFIRKVSAETSDRCAMRGPKD